MEKDGQRLDKPTFSGTWTDKVVADMPNGTHWTLFETRPIPMGPTSESWQHSPHRLCLAVISLRNVYVSSHPIATS